MLTPCRFSASRTSCGDLGDSFQLHPVLAHIRVLPFNRWRVCALREHRMKVAEDSIARVELRRAGRRRNQTHPSGDFHLDAFGVLHAEIEVPRIDRPPCSVQNAPPLIDLNRIAAVCSAFFLWFVHCLIRRPSHSSPRDFLQFFNAAVKALVKPRVNFHDRRARRKVHEGFLDTAALAFGHFLKQPV